jgi:ABC-2 type transport system permease protein
MAVFEHSYRPFTGTTTPVWSRFLIIPKSAYRSVFQSKIFIAFFAGCFIPPLIMAIMIYLKHNVNALGVLQLQINELLPIDANFFYTFVWVQCYLSFFLAVLVGPPLISRDVENNGLPLYLARPLSRAEYVVGKLCVLLILMSAVTWVPLLLIFFFEAYLEGWSWFTDNYWMAGAIYFGTFLWIVVVALLTLAVSAWVKWRVVASGLLVGLFFIPRVLTGVINEIIQTNWANLFSLQSIMTNIWLGLFGLFERDHDKRSFDFGRRVTVPVIHWEPYLWCNWLMLALICGICLMMLYARVRAYEVVR